MFYISFCGEVETRMMIKKAQNLGKIVAVPVCSGAKAVTPCRLTPDAQLVRGRYSVCEPAVRKPISLEDLDLVIVPGIAFDKKGNRLGRGKGCYDYFLKALPKRIPAIGLAYDFQILPSVPATKRDIGVDGIVFA